MTRFLSIVFSVILSASASAYTTAHWIWAGLSANDAPSNSHLYIYQGFLSGSADRLSFQKKGIFAHPLQAQSVILVYRSHSFLIDVPQFLNLFKTHRQQWEAHKVNVKGVQLDFDVPTSQLRHYSLVLSKIRTALEKHYTLSITGLADWSVSAKTEHLNALHNSVDEVVYQSYQIRSYFPNVERYIRALEANKRPYKLGLLAHTPAPFSLEGRSYMTGLVYFIQRSL